MLLCYVMFLGSPGTPHTHPNSAIVAHHKPKDHRQLLISDQQTAVFPDPPTRTNRSMS